MSESLTEKCSTHLISAEGGNKKKIAGYQTANIAFLAIRD